MEKTITNTSKINQILYRLTLNENSTTKKKEKCNRLLHPLFIAKVNEHQLIKTPEKKVHILNVNHNLAELKTNDGLSNGMYM